MDPKELKKYTPEYLSNLNEAEQLELLESLKVELAEMLTQTKSKQIEVVRKIQRSLLRHEAQLNWVNSELQGIEDALEAHDSENDNLDQKRARNHLFLGRRFHKASRKMLVLQLESLREDLSAAADEIKGEFTTADPFVSYAYRRASAEADLAATQMLMGDINEPHRFLAEAVGVAVMPPEEQPGQGKALEGVEASRTIEEKMTSKTGGLGVSEIPLDEDIPPAPGLGALEIPLEILEAQAAAAARLAERAEAGELMYDGEDLEMTEEDRENVQKLKTMLEADQPLLDRATILANLLQEANGTLREAKAKMATLLTLPPTEGARILDEHLWSKLNGRLYFLQRLGDQCADAPLLAMLFPKSELKTLPFERIGNEPATRPLGGATTDRLGLD